MGLIKSGKSKKSVSEVGGPVISGNLRLHELRSRIFRNMRLVRVWLPPDYDASSATRYPVLYLNDDAVDRRGENSAAHHRGY